MFTETWLKPTTGDAKLGLRNFTVLRLDRHDTLNAASRGGWVLIVVNKKFKSSLLQNNSGTDFLFKTQFQGINLILAFVCFLPGTEAV